MLPVTLDILLLGSWRAQEWVSLGVLFLLEITLQEHTWGPCPPLCLISHDSMAAFPNKCLGDTRQAPFIPHFKSFPPEVALNEVI